MLYWRRDKSERGPASARILTNAELNAPDQEGYVMGELISMHCGARPVHEVPADFNPVIGLYLNEKEHAEAQEAFFICESILHMLYDKCMVMSDYRDQRFIDAANVAAAAQEQLQKIGALLGK